MLPPSRGRCPPSFVSMGQPMTELQHHFQAGIEKGAKKPRFPTLKRHWRGPRLLKPQSQDGGLERTCGRIFPRISSPISGSPEKLFSKMRSYSSKCEKTKLFYIAGIGRDPVSIYSVRLPGPGSRKLYMGGPPNFDTGRISTRRFRIRRQKFATYAKILHGGHTGVGLMCRHRMRRRPEVPPSSFVGPY